MMRNSLVLLGLLLVPSTEVAWAHSSPNPAVSSVTITRPISPKFGGPFSLINQNKRAVSSADFRGMPTLIYFGYTNCRDACLSIGIGSGP